MTEFDWIIDTSADLYEYGEELYFRTSTWCYVTGRFLRQEGEDIIVKVTNVEWGPNDWVGDEMKFTEEHICEKINIESMFTMSYETYEISDWDIYTEELLEEEQEDIYNPTIIGTTNTIDKTIITIGNYTNRPRDGPTTNHENYKKKRINNNNINQYEETINNYHNTMVPSNVTNDIM
jgi:hypothetical protein